jgi:nucleotide-binding universal stress UspA family protein
MKIKKIVVGTDFSPEADAALNQATEIARHSGAELTILHAVAPADRHAFADLPDGESDTWEQLVQAQRTEERTRLEALRQLCQRRGVSAELVLAAEAPHQALSALAEELSADLVVVGTHSSSGIRRILLGSVAERVVRSAETNVLVARAVPSIEGGFQRVLVPTDFSELANRALRMALAVAAANATIEIFHSWSLPATAVSTAIPGADAAVTSLRGQLAAHAQLQYEQLVADYQDRPVQFRFHHAEQAPSQGIIDRLHGSDVQLVVLGSHSRRGLRRWFLGSVAETTVRYAPCSVLVTSQAGDRSDED